MLFHKALVLCAAAVSVSEAFLTGSIITSYFDSGSGNWAVLSDAIRNSGKASSMYVILNTSNGIVSGTSSAWQNVAQNVHNAGGKVLVYVDTCSVSASTIKSGLTKGCASAGGKQGGASPSAVAAYVQNWIAFLGGNASSIDGVFLDDTPVSGLAAFNVGAIAKAIRSLPGMSHKFLVANQGGNATPYPSALMPGVAVDVSVQQEGGTTIVASNTDIILKNVTSLADAVGKAESAGSKGFGYFYAAASYGSLPSYIGNLLKCIGGGTCTHL